MGRKFNQFLLLIWKNYVLQKRHIVRTIFEIGLPILVGFLMLWLRTLVSYTSTDDPTFYKSFSVDELPLSLQHRGSPVWRMAYSPNGTAEDTVMDLVKNNLAMLETGRGFATEEDMLNFLAQNDTVDTSDFLGGITFHNAFPSETDLPANITYSIRLKASQRNYPNKQVANMTGQTYQWYTGSLFPLLVLPGPRETNYTDGGEPGYSREGFLALQYAVDRALLHFKNIDTDDFSLEMERYPYPPYITDDFIIVIQLQLPYFLLLSLVVTAVTITKEVVLEREKKLKESMKIMGLSNWLHWTAWYLKYAVFLLISVLILTTLFKVPVGNNGAVINHIDFTVLLMFLFVFSLVTIAQCFAVSVFFSTANTAAVCMGLIWFMSYVPYFFIYQKYATATRALKVAACLLPNTGMAMGAYIIGLFEGTGEGVQWYNLSRPVSVDDNLTMLDVLLMFLVDIVWCLLVMWYVEAVFPGNYGVPRRWYFPFQVSYWCGATYGHRTTELPDQVLKNGPGGQSFFETEPKDLRAGVQIQNLTKMFNKKNAPAVDGLSLNMYEGQITALLGHNGAGKTTTLSMLTGMFTVTSGTALVNDLDIRTEIDGVRHSLGLCPQHDILFDRLTVSEHLYFYAKLKDCPSDRTKKEIDYYIDALQLEDKRHIQARNLSGGMKRKLCVAIALIYDSKVVMLDEPTSGMDPSARRFTWDVLQRHRADRTILLTTHHMDEADLLGDRIAIMANGKLQCCGSSMFLKRKYGVGYHMTIAKAPSCNEAGIKELISRHVPGVEMENNVGTELSFILPEESVAEFEQLFTDLQDRQGELGIDSYGVSVTTMEEVFLKVDQEEQDVARKPSIRETTIDDENSTLAINERRYDNDQSYSDLEGLVVVSKRNTGLVLYLQQFRAMFQKRMYHTWRNLLVMSVQLLIPLIMTVVALLAAQLSSTAGDSPALKVDIATYGTTDMPYFLASNDTELLKLSSDYAAYAVQLEQNPVSVSNATNLEDYLVDSSSRQLVTFNRKNLAAASFDAEDGTLKGTVFFNNQPYHAAPAALGAIDNALMRYHLEASHTITTVNHPLPRTTKQAATDDLTDQLYEGFTIAFNMLFGMSILASSFVLFLVKERATKAKHVQFVSGVHSLNFWLSTLLWDLINYMVPCVLIVATFAAFGVDAYVDDGRFLDILLLLFLHGWSIIPLMYLLSFMFDVPSTAFVRLTTFNVLFGIIAFMAVFVLEMPELNLTNVANILSWIFSLSPSFCLGKGLADFYENYGVIKLCTSSLELEFICALESDDPQFKYNANYLGVEPPGIGRELIFLAGTGVLYFFLVILLEEGILRSIYYRIQFLFAMCRCRKVKHQEDALTSGHVLDEDVAAEKQRILADSSALSDALVLKDLRKVYSTPGKPSVTAVEGTYLGIAAGECFGLLGVNGAGKTTTFKMLTGDEAVTGGEAYVDGCNIKENIQQVQQRIGYCPQSDALIDQMTGRETLRLFARLRGMKESTIEAKVKELLVMFNLMEHADKQTKAYSGGNKRKLSTTIALIGDPPIVFLDEPSTGMDPGTKRLLWKALCQVRNEGRCIVLTSHSMEECEALCSRLAIMVNGQIKCLGGTQHLKSRFGEGFTVLAKKSTTEGVPDMTELKQFMETEFIDCKLKDEHQGMVHYHITNMQLSWSRVFGIMEKAKAMFGIEDYSVSQTTLEQVFLNFARMQVEDET